MLQRLYIAADKFDVPVIRTLVKQQLAEHTPRDAFKVAFELELEEEKKRSLDKMSKKDVVHFLTNCYDSQMTSIQEVKAMMNRCGISKFSISPKCFPPPEKSPIPENFDEAWGTSNEVLRTRDCENKLVYVNSSVLASFSPFFRVLFFGDSADKLQNVVDLDVEHEILLDILRILHHVNRNFGTKGHANFGEAKIGKLYTAADLLDIEVIRELCRQQILEASPVEAFGVAIELNLAKEKEAIFEKMTLDEIHAYLSKNKDSEFNVFSPKEIVDLIWKMKQGMDGRLRCPACNSSSSVGSVQPKTADFAFLCPNAHNFNH